MKLHLARLRALLALLLALAALTLGSIVLPSGAASAATSIPLPIDNPICIDAEGIVGHCPDPCFVSVADSFPSCPPCPTFGLTDDPTIGLCPYDPGPIVPFPTPAPTPAPAPTDPAPAPRPMVRGVLAVRDFVAFVNAQPLSPRKLIVTGTVVVSSPAISVRLRPTDPQGINPRILLLDTVVTRSPRIVPQVVREVSVRFESTNFVDLDEVNIPDLGLRLPVSVAV